MATVDPVYLVPYIRLAIGDINPLAYRYTDTWVDVALEASITSLARWWNARYLLDANKDVYRNTYIPNAFTDLEPPVIQISDERPIILMASIIILEGSLESSAWNIGYWKDNEISVSNIEQGRLRTDTLKRMWDELNSLILPPTKRLAKARKQSLPGFKDNPIEQKTDY
jgi:hypothetical protein